MPLDAKRCAELRISYVRQILIFIEVGNPYGHLLRTLLDSWHAAKHGWPFLTRPRGLSAGYSPIHLNSPRPNGNRQALMLLRHSRAANDIMHYRASGALVKDHAVPVATIHQWLCAADLKRVDEVDDFLSKWFRVALLTKEEHDALPSDIRSAMPRLWDTADPWARYADIEMLPDPDPLQGC